MPDYDSEFRRIQSILGWLKTELAQMKSSKPLVGEGLAPGPWAIRKCLPLNSDVAFYIVQDDDAEQVLSAALNHKADLDFICMARDQAGKEQKVSLPVIEFLTNAIKVYEAQWEDLEESQK